MKFPGCLLDCNQTLLLRWTFQGLARNELEGVKFYPAGCVAQGMPGATADEIHKVSRQSLTITMRVHEGAAKL